eukprot:Nk52_evm44s343 gene=Nk52_evmTU44s343
MRFSSLARDSSSEERMQEARRLVLYYFSDENYLCDEYMMLQSKDALRGEIPVSVLYEFRKLKQTNIGIKQLKELIKREKELELSPDEDYVRRVTPYSNINGVLPLKLDVKDHIENCNSVQDLRELCSSSKLGFFLIHKAHKECFVGHPGKNSRPELPGVHTNKDFACLVNKAVSLKAEHVLYEYAVEYAGKKRQYQTFVLNMAHALARHGKIENAVELLCIENDDSNIPYVWDAVCDRKNPSEGLLFFTKLRENGLELPCWKFFLSMLACGMQSFKEISAAYYSYCSLPGDSRITDMSLRYSVVKKKTSDKSKPLQDWWELMKSKDMKIETESYLAYFSFLGSELKSSVNSVRLLSEMKTEMGLTKQSILEQSSLFNPFVALALNSNNPYFFETIKKMKSHALQQLSLKELAIISDKTEKKISGMLSSVRKQWREEVNKEIYRRWRTFDVEQQLADYYWEQFCFILKDRDVQTIPHYDGKSEKVRGYIMTLRYGSKNDCASLPQALQLAKEEYPNIDLYFVSMALRRRLRNRCNLTVDYLSSLVGEERFEKMKMNEAVAVPLFQYYCKSLKSSEESRLKAFETLMQFRNSLPEGSTYGVRRVIDAVEEQNDVNNIPDDVLRTVVDDIFSSKSSIRNVVQYNHLDHSFPKKRKSEFDRTHPVWEEFLDAHDIPEQSTLTIIWKEDNKGTVVLSEHNMSIQSCEFACKVDANEKFCKYVKSLSDNSLYTMMSDKGTVMKVMSGFSEDQEAWRKIIACMEKNGQLIRISKREEAKEFDDARRAEEMETPSNGNGDDNSAVSTGDKINVQDDHPLVGDKCHRIMFISDNKEFAEKITEEFHLAGNGHDISHFYNRFSEFIAKEHKGSFPKLFSSNMYTKNKKRI